MTPYYYCNCPNCQGIGPEHEESLTTKGQSSSFHDQNFKEYQDNMYDSDSIEIDY